MFWDVMQTLMFQPSLHLEFVTTATGTMLVVHRLRHGFTETHRCMVIYYDISFIQ